jgi:hypothetical protein
MKGRRRFGAPAKVRVDVRWFGLWGPRPLAFWSEVGRRAAKQRGCDVQRICEQVEGEKRWVRR